MGKSYKQEARIKDWYVLPTRLLVDLQGNFICTTRVKDYVASNPDKFFRCATPAEESFYWAKMPKNIAELNATAK